MKDAATAALLAGAHAQMMRAAPPSRAPTALKEREGCAGRSGLAGAVLMRRQRRQGREAHDRCVMPVRPSVSVPSSGGAAAMVRATATSGFGTGKAF